MIPLYDISGISKFVETDSRLVVTRGWGEKGEMGSDYIVGSGCISEVIKVSIPERGGSCSSL